MADYTTIEANDQLIQSTNYSNNTIENLLIDLTTGNDCAIYLEGDNPTIRNIGFKGTFHGSGFLVQIGGPYGTEATGTATIDTVYIGDGNSYEGASHTHGPGGMFAHSNSPNANIEVYDTTARGNTNNGFYFENANWAEWHRCYTVNCGVTHYRTYTGEVHNCVGYNTSDERHGHGSGGERFGRCVWTRGGNGIDVYDSNLAGGPRSGADLVADSTSQITMHSGDFSGSTYGPVTVASAVGSSPSHVAPDSAPLTAEEAASDTAGSGDDGSGDDGSTSDPHIYESWEDGPSSLDKYSYDTHEYGVPEAVSRRHGQYILRGSGSIGQIYYNGYGPERGDVFAQSYYPASGQATDYRMLLYFAVQSSAGNDADRYAIQTNHVEGVLELGIHENGSWSWPTAAAASFDPSGLDGQWNDFYVDFGHTNQDTIEAWLEDNNGNELASFAYDDTRFDAGGWGYSIWSNQNVDIAGWADYFRQIDTEPDPPRPPTNLSVPTITADHAEVYWNHSPDYTNAESEDQA